MTQPAKEDILGIECRFATYCPPPDYDRSVDLHVVKEIIHKKDGTTQPNLRLWPNYKVPYWVTKKGCQDHTQKKEWENIERLDEYSTTVKDKNMSIAKSLGMNWFKPGESDPRLLSRSPYLYGSDILSTAVLKHSYQTKFPDLNTPYTLSCFDTEKDVVNGTNEINMATLSMGGRVFTAVQRSFVEGLTDVENQAHAAFKKYLGAFEKVVKNKQTGEEEVITVDLIQERGLNWEFELVDNEIDILIRCFAKAHEWMPDYVSVWNIDFDMPLMLKACERARLDPKDLFCDPKVPQRFRHFRYKQGKKQKKTASGKVTPIKPADQWHTVYCPASFYWIDGMCVYRKIRSQKGEEPKYSLDYILQKNLGMRKLKFKQADHVSGIDWHLLMQTQFRIEYIIYNVFDCISMEILDEETKDLQLAMPQASGCSDFETFKSQPRRSADALHYFTKERGKIFGSTSDDMVTDLDQHVLGLDGWIVTLPAHLVADNGLQVIEEYPDLRTNIRGHVGDLDVSASYPNGECVFNISKSTTRKELCKVQGVQEYMQRMQGINLSAGHVNAVEFCENMYGMPSLETLLHAFMKEEGLAPAAPQLPLSEPVDIGTVVPTHQMPLVDLHDAPLLVETGEEIYIDEE